MSTIKTYGQIKEAYEKKYINEAIESNDSTRFDVKLQEFDVENGNLCRYDGSIIIDDKLKALDQAMRQKYGVF
jgi:hypothetical protein